MGLKGGKGEPLELLPLGTRGEALLVTHRKPDKTRVAELRPDLVCRAVKKACDTVGSERKALLQIEQRLERIGARAVADRGQVAPVGIERLSGSAPERIQHHAAADRADVGLIAQDESVAGERDRRFAGYDLRKPLFLGRERDAILEQDHAAKDLAGADEEADARIVLERTPRGRANFHPRIETRSGKIEPLIRKHLPSPKLDPLRHRQVERNALASPGALHRNRVNLDRADTHLVAAGQHAQLLPDPHLRAHPGAGDDRAMAFVHEGAVERKAEDSRGAARIEALETARYLRAQITETR